MSASAAVPTSPPTGGRHPLGRSPVGATTPARPSARPHRESSPAEPLPAHVLADIAAGFAAAEPLWSAVVRHDPTGRRPVRLIATERYEVWVIGWTTDQHVRVHDHGDSAGAVVVTAGELTEVLPDGRGGAIARSLAVGRVRHLAVGVVHDVVNRSPRSATSIHVYSPPLTHMTYYDARTFQPIGSEPVAPERPVLGPSAGAHVLHPARRSGA